MNKRDVFNADAALEMTIKNGGLDLITLEGGARFLSDKDMKGGAVTGVLNAGYDHGKGLFYANAALTASLANGLIKGSGTFDVHLEKGIQTNNQLKWHLRFGRAPGAGQGSPVTLNLANLAKVEGYYVQLSHDFDQKHVLRHSINRKSYLTMFHLLQGQMTFYLLKMPIQQWVV